VGSGAEPRLKTNLIHSKAVKKPLVAIILNILSRPTMFCVFEEMNWRWDAVARIQHPCHISRVYIVSDGVNPSPKGEVGGAGSAPSKSATY